jgi:hypothetical protein
LELEATGITTLGFDLATNNPTVTITGDWTIDIDSTGGIVLDASSNALTLRGHLVDEITGAGTFTADSQSLTLSGTANQDIDPCGGTWGLVTVNKAGDVGSVTFSGDMDATGIDVDAAANVDFGDSRSHAWGSAGMVFDHTGNVDLGTGTTHTVTGGDYDYEDIGGTLTVGTGTVVMAGTGSIVFKHNTDGCYNLTVNAGAVSTITNNTGPNRNCKIVNAVSLSGTLDTGTDALRVDYNGYVSVESGGRLTGNRAFFVFNGAGGFAKNEGTVDCTTVDLHVYSNPGVATLAAGAYDTTFRIYEAGYKTTDLKLAAGATSFTNLELEVNSTYTLTLDLATNNPTVTITGDLTVDIDSTGGVTLDASSNALVLLGDLVDEITGAGTFTADSQDITLSGTANQDIDPCGGTWGLVTVNKAGDVGSVIFSGDGECDGLDVTAADSIDFSDNVTMTYGASGVYLPLAWTGDIDLGLGTTHYCAGQFHIYNSNGGFDGGTSHIIFNGSTLYTYKPGRFLYDVTVASGADYTQRASYGTVVISNDMIIQGDAILASTVLRIDSNANFYLDGGTVSSGRVIFSSTNSGYGLQQLSGTFSPTLCDLDYCKSGSVFVGGTWDCDVRLHGASGVDSYCAPTSDLIITGELELEAQTSNDVTMDLATNNIQLTVQGDLRLDIDHSSSAAIITKSSYPLILYGDLINEVAAGLLVTNYQDITLTGTNDQDFDQPSASVFGTLTINKTAGTVTPQSVMTCNEFIGQDGTFDPNAQTINVLAIGGGSGNCDWQANFEFVSHEDAFNSCSWTIGGNFTADGQSLKATGGYIDDVPAAIDSGTSRFFGDNDYIDAGEGQQLSSFTLSGWCKNVPYENAIYTIVSRTESANPWERNYILAIGPFNELQLLSRASGTSYSVISQPAGFYGNSSAFDTWHHIAVTWSGGTEQFYLDGSPVASFAGSVPAVGSPTSPDLQVGAYSGANTFDGLLDDVRVYSDVLTADEITYLYTNGISGDDPGTDNLQAYWKFDGNLLDETDNDNDGTSVGLDAPDWTLTVAGTAVASGVGEVAYSDASGGTIIDASAGPWVNNGDNDWWCSVLWAIQSICRIFSGLPNRHIYCLRSAKYCTYE